MDQSNNFNNGYPAPDYNQQWQPQQFDNYQQQVPQVDTPVQTQPVEQPVPREEPTAEFDDKPAVQEDDAEDDIDAAVEANQQRIRSGERKVTGWDKVGLYFPLSSPEKTGEHLVAEQKTVTDDDPRLSDMSSDLMVLAEAIRAFTNSAELVTEALTKIAPETEVAKYLKERVDSFGINNAKVASRYLEQEGDTVLEGKDARKIFTILTGGMRRVTLWNSGITVTIRNLTLDQINKFLHELNHTDFQYGRQYGGLYYLFADLEISKYIVEKLFPTVICGSSFLEWRDTDKLLKVIKWQDFHVIVWALASMMYPNGANIRLICSEENCRHIEDETVDLAKMRLNNIKLINEKMVAHFASLRVKGQEFQNYQSIQQYQKDTGFERTVTFTYGSGDSEREVELTLRQASISDYLDVGTQYNAELARQTDLYDADKVSQYIAFTQYRCFSSWIKSFKITTDLKGKKKSFILNNFDENGDRIDNEDNRLAVQMILDEFQQYVPDFETKLKDYILSTKVSHIAFYYPECTKCHHKTENSYGGFIPYDPVQAFFILGFSKLMRATSRK